MTGALGSLNVPWGDQSWRQRAACQGVPLAYFFAPTSPDGLFRRPRRNQTKPAPPDLRREAVVRFCVRCEVRSECLLEALVANDQGVRGGLDEAERAELRRVIKDPDGRRYLPPAVRAAQELLREAMAAQTEDLCPGCGQRARSGSWCPRCAAPRSTQALDALHSLVPVELAQDPRDTLRRALVLVEGGERPVLIRDGKPVAALIAPADLELLVELENLDDMRAAEAARAKGGESLPAEQVHRSA